MLELAQLKFAVDTSELKTAVDLVKTLGDATRELGQDVSKLATADKNAAAASLMNAKARKENAQAAAQEAKNTKAAVAETSKKVKAEKEAADATTQRVQAENKAAEASTRSAKAAKSNTDMLQRQQDVLEFMTQGYTRGQARQMAMYKSTGALTDQLKEMGNVLQSQNRLIGGDPFDKSSSHIRKMQQEVTELTHGLKYLDQGMIGSSDQLRGFTRDSIRLVEAAKSQGRSIFSIRDALREQRQEYQSTIGVHSQLIAQEREQERLSKERAKALVNQAKANDYVTNEMNRAENALQGLNGQLQISSSNRILKFEQALNKSGLSVEQRTAQLEKYKAVILATDAARAKSASRASMEQSERQVNLLARSLAPQISDVLVSLQTGMNPFTVMMQQGMQVRDLIQLSGVETEKLGEAFKRAGQGMITTSLAAGKAIGSMILGVIVDAGKMVTDFGLRVTGLGSHFKVLRDNFIGMAASGDKFLSFLGNAGLAIGRFSSLAVGLGVALPVAAILGFALGLRQVIKEENELAKALALNAANLNISHSAAIQYAKSFDNVAASTRQVIGVLTEMAKVGQFSKEQFDLVVTSAIEMERYADVAIEDTVKSFAKMKEKPVEALLELAKTTGMVPPAVQQMVLELERSGDSAGATALAIQALADVNETQISRMKEDYNGFSMFIINLGGGIKRFFAEAFKDLFYAGDARTQIQTRIAKINQQINNSLFARLGITKESLEQRKADLEHELRVMDITEAAQEAEVKANSESARLKEKAQAAHISALSEEEKHKIKLRDIDKDIAKAREQQDLESLASFEKLRKKTVEDYEEKLKKKNKQKKGPSENFAERSLYAFSKAAIEAENRSEDLTRSQLKLLQIMEDPRWAGLSNAEQSRIKAQAEEAITYEKAARSAEWLNKMEADAANYALERAEKRADAAKTLEESLKETTRAIDAESKALEFQSGLIGKNSEERAKSLEFYKLQIEYEEELRKIRENPNAGYDPAWRATQELKAYENLQKKKENLQTKYDIEYNQKLTDDLTDAVMTGLIEGGKAGKKKLRDLIVAELQKPIQVFIQATISNIFGGGNGGLTGGSGGWLGAALDYITGGSGSGGGFGQGIMSTVSSFFTQGSGKGIGGMVQNAVTNAFAHYGTASTYGTAFGSQQTAMLAAQESGMGTAAGGSGAGAAAGWAAFAYAMYKIAENSYKKDWTENSAGLSKDGERGGSSYSFGRTTFQHDLSQSEFKGLGKGIAAIADVTYKDAEKFGIASSKWNYIMSGMQVMSMLFGRKLKGYGYNVDIQGSEVDVGGYQYYKGGLFRSNKTTEFDVNPKDAENVRIQVEAIRAGTRAMSLALGGGTEAIDNFTGNLKIDFKGAETAAEQAERMSEAWDKLQAEMLTAGTGIEYTKEKIKEMREEAMALASAGGYNEQGITDALVGGMTGRMSEADVGAALGDIIVGSVYNALAMGFANQITGMITSMIIQPIMTTIIAGGSITAAVSSASINAVVSQAQAAINAFNQVIADPAFQGMIGQLNSMVGNLASISVKPARNIKSFGSAVRSAGNAAKEAADKIKKETYDLQTELLQALGMTDKLRQRELANINSTNHALKKQIWALEDAKSLYEKMQDAAKDSLDKAKEVQDNLKQIFDYLLENINELRGEVSSTNRMQVQEANAALLGMIASGSVDSYEKLQEIVGVLRDDVAGTTYATKVEQDRANLKLSNLLETLKVSAGTELEKVDQEIALLETAIEKAEEQINALLGIQTNTFSTAEAIQALNAAVGAYSAQIAAAIGMTASFSTGATPSSSSSSGSKSSGGRRGGGGGGSSTSDPSRAANINKLYQMVLGRAGDQKGIDAYAATKLSLAQVAADLAASKEFDNRYGSRADEITALYKGLLGRNPDEAGLANYLNSNLSIGQIAKVFVESSEFKKLRGFASGGYYPGGSAIVGERGPELIDFTRPGRVYTAGETQAIMGNSNDARIDARLATLETAMTQMVVATNKMQKVLNNARGDDGTSLNVTITNSQPVKVTS